MTSNGLCVSDEDIRLHVLEPFAEGVMAGAMSMGLPDPANDLAPVLEEAYQRGLAEGRQHAEQGLAQTAQSLARAISQARAEAAGLRETLQREALQLSMAIARRLLLTELRVRPEAVAEMVAQLLDDAEDRKVSALHLNPADAEKLNGTSIPAMLTEAGITVHASDEIARGGCVLETAFGKLDARLETRIDEIASRLLSEEHARSAEQSASATAGGEER